jgi:hypothetical protein
MNVQLTNFHYNESATSCVHVSNPTYITQYFLQAKGASNSSFLPQNVSHELLQ